MVAGPGHKYIVTGGVDFQVRMPIVADVCLLIEPAVVLCVLRIASIHRALCAVVCNA